MTDPTPHRATPEQWAQIERWAENGSIYSPLILELRARVEVLEAGATCPHIVSSDEGTSYCALAEQRQPDHFADAGKMVSAGSLVELVMTAGGMGLTESARAAIRAVAAAARLRDLNGKSVAVMTWEGIAQWLEQEADRG